MPITNYLDIFHTLLPLNSSEYMYVLVCYLDMKSFCKVWRHDHGPPWARALVKLWISRTNIFGAAADTSPPLLQLSSWRLWSQPQNSWLANWEKLGDQQSYFQLHFITRYPHLLTPLFDLPTLLKQKYRYMLEYIRIWYNRMHSIESKK